MSVGTPNRTGEQFAVRLVEGTRLMVCVRQRAVAQSLEIDHAGVVDLNRNRHVERQDLLKGRTAAASRARVRQDRESPLFQNRIDCRRNRLPGAYFVRQIETEYVNIMFIDPS